MTSVLRAVTIIMPIGERQSVRLAASIAGGDSNGDQRVQNLLSHLTVNFVRGSAHTEHQDQVNNAKDKVRDELFFTISHPPGFNAGFERERSRPTQTSFQALNA